MKKAALKSMLAVLTALCLLATVFVPLAGAVTTESAADVRATCPTIFVHGFMSSDVYSNPGTDTEELLWPPSADDIMAAVKKALPSIAEFGITRNWNKLGDSVSEIALDLMSKAFNNIDGSAPANTGIDWTYPSHISQTATVNFRYDWRADPVLVAGELNDFINYVLDKTGCDEVALDCHSMGGIVVMSYLALYGMDKVKGITFDSTAIFGETYNGELFTGQIMIDGEALYEFLQYALFGTENEEALNMLMDALFAVGAFDVVESLGMSILDHLVVRASKEVLLPMFGGWLGVWAMIPDSEYAVAEDHVFNTVLKDDGKDYTALREKLDFYNENVRAHKTEILQELFATKRMGVISRYGFCSIPITPSWRSLSDGVVDTKYSSFGATTSAYKEKLDDAYLESHTSLGYISPDEMVDASTCMFPDNTWFIKNLPHSWSDDEMDVLKTAIVFADEPVTINTYEEYPQYLMHNAVDDSITPFTDYEEPEANALVKYGFFMQKIRDTLKAFIQKMIDTFRSYIPALYES